jgi:hypothetical protein
VALCEAEVMEKGYFWQLLFRINLSKQWVMNGILEAASKRLEHLCMKRAYGLYAADLTVRSTPST